MPKLICVESVSASKIGTNVKITLPQHCVIEVVQDDDQNKKLSVLAPPDLAGTMLRSDDDLLKKFRDYEQHTRKESYRESINAVLKHIRENFDSLPKLRSSTPTRLVRDLGRTDNWIKYDVKTWLHHANRHIQNPSITLEEIELTNNEKHLAVVMYLSW